jgi:hypothetical protein
VDRRPIFIFLCMLIACSGSTPRATTSPTPRRTSTPRTSHPAPSKTPPTVTNANISRATCGTAGRLVAFRIAIDKGLPTTAAEFGNGVRSVLCDPRSWIASQKVRFRYDPNGKLLISLRTPDHTESRCMQLIHLSVERTYSCATFYEVVLNSDRWFYGSRPWPGPLAEYREMVTNHETGHALGLYHENCPRDGALAPVMAQQSKGLTSPNGKTCVRNSWPLREELARL